MFRRLYFVLSPSFHGATLLAKLINAHPEITSLGDTLPDNDQEQVCGCGKKVRDCGFWQSVRQDTAADRYDGRIRRMLPQYPGDQGSLAGRVIYSDFTSFWASPKALRLVHSQSQLRLFRREFEDFVHSIYLQTPSPGSVFVDGVKFVSRVAALEASGVEIGGIVHIYRNPEDFVYSSIRNTGRGGWRGILEHSLRYRAYHRRARQVAAHVGSELSLSYEALADSINQELERLFVYIGVEPKSLEELQARFEQEWHFMGNAELFEFDGVVKRKHREVPETERRLIRLLAGRPPVGIDRIAS